MMATQGKRVLLADFDPQCNLTGMVMGFKGVDDLAALCRIRPRSFLFMLVRASRWRSS